MAREILRYSVSLQSRASGETPYGSVPLCEPYDLIDNSDDLDFWLLMAAARVRAGLAGPRLLLRAAPFQRQRQQGQRLATPEDRLRPPGVAARPPRRLPRGRQRRLVGLLGDLPPHARVDARRRPARLRLPAPCRAGRAARRSRLRREAAGSRRRVAWRQCGASGRGGAGTRAATPRPELQIGSGAIFGEPQPWAILSGAPGAPAGRAAGRQHPPLPRPGSARRRRSAGRRGSAPPNPPPRPIPASPSPPPPSASTAPPSTWAGVWYDVNGWLTWALASLDGTVPGAARYAWSEYTRNTLAAHATAFPRHWDGTISVDDACNAFYASPPREAAASASTPTTPGRSPSSRPGW